MNKPSSASSDEIDLSQVVQLLKNGVNGISMGFLRFFLYLKENFVILASLVFIGFAIGFALKFIISDELKTEVIVKPNFGSKDYLYNVVAEIESNLKTKDTVFFKDLGIVISEIKSLRVEIEQITEAEDETDQEDQLEFLSVLQNFKEDAFVLETVKAEVQKKNNMHHRITFFYKNALAGRAASLKLMEYIENNPYFTDLRKIHNENAKLKIEKNQELIDQIDNLISGYVDNMAKPNTSQATFSLDAENGLDMTSLLNLKNSLVSNIELKKMELAEEGEVIQVINYGKNQVVRTPIYAQGITVVPVILLTFFFLYSIIRFLNKKALEIEG